MIWKRKLLTGNALLKRADELGVSRYKSYDSLGTFLEHELQARVLNAERHMREHWLWIVALLSAVASVLSAAAAWWAIYHHP